MTLTRTIENAYLEAMLGDDLSDHARAMGEVWTYVTDDGELSV